MELQYNTSELQHIAQLICNMHEKFENEELILDAMDAQFVQQHNLRQGLKLMWEWAQKQPHKERFVWDQYELEKGIYSFWK